MLPLHSAAAQTIDTARVTAALQSARIPQAQALDLKQEADSLYAGYLSEAIHLSLAGIVALTILLLIALRSPLRVARVLAPLALAVLCVAAGLAMSGVQLTHTAPGGHAAHRRRRLELRSVLRSANESAMPAANR